MRANLQPRYRQSSLRVGQRRPHHGHNFKGNPFAFLREHSFAFRAGVPESRNKRSDRLTTKSRGSGASSRCRRRDALITISSSIRTCALPRRPAPEFSVRPRLVHFVSHAGTRTSVFVRLMRIQVFVEQGLMGFGRGALLWLIGIPLPIILLSALFMHH
jgi:hypothetical protein